MNTEVDNAVIPLRQSLISHGFVNWNIDAAGLPLYNLFLQMINQEGEFEDHQNTTQITKEDLARAKNMFIAHTASRGSVPFEIILRYTNDSDRSYSILSRGAITDWDAYGNPCSMSGCNMDITNFATLKNKFSLRNEQYKLTIDNINAGIWDWEIATGKEWWSDNFYKLLGYEPEEIEASYDCFLNTLLHPDDKNAVLLAVSDHFEKRIPYLLEVRMLHKDGNYYWFETSGKARLNDNGDAVRMTGSIINRHKKKMLETELKKYKELVDEMSSMTKTGGWEFYWGGQPPLWTKEIFDIHEVPYNEQPAIDEAINFYCGESRTIITRVFTELTEQGKPYDRELEMVTAKGRKIWVRTIGKPLVNDKGKIIGATGTLQDITESKQREIELEKSNTIIADQNKRLQNFAHIVTHNLRTHAGNLKSVLSILAHSNNEAEKNEMLDCIEKISSSLSNTIADLTDIVKAENSDEPANSVIRFEDVLTNLMHALAPVINETQTVIDASFYACREIDYIPAYLESIMFNLVSNAIKYRHPQRTPHIKIMTFTEGNKKCLSVSDNGIGIDLSKHSDKIFGMYKTFHNHPDARGVGLYLTKNMIEKNGGTISVSSTPGTGTAFIVKF